MFLALRRDHKFCIYLDKVHHINLYMGDHKIALNYTGHYTEICHTLHNTSFDKIYVDSSKGSLPHTEHKEHCIPFHKHCVCNDFHIFSYTVDNLRCNFLRKHDSKLKFFHILIYTVYAADRSCNHCSSLYAHVHKQVCMYILCCI